MNKYLDKYKGGVSNESSDFDMGDEKRRKKKQVVKQDVLENVDLGDYAPVVVNNDVANKLEAEKKRQQLLNSVKRDSDAGWKVVSNSQVKVEEMNPKVRHGSPDPVQRHDLSPPRRRARHDSDQEDLSPPRRATRNDSDLSPPRRRPRNESPKRDLDLSPPRRKNDLVGLVSSEKLNENLDAKQEMERSQFKKMNTSLTGQGAGTIFRDKDGKRISEQEYVDMKKKEKEQKKDFVIKTEFEWGTGLVQKRQQMTEEDMIQQEMSKPFTRYAGQDEDIEDDLKRIIREGDPMEKFLKKKKSKRHKHEKRQVDFPPNRYMIAPGSKWDGVDRSNGYEKTYLQNLNKKQIEIQKGYQDL